MTVKHLHLVSNIRELCPVFMHPQPKAIRVLQTKVHILIFGVFSRKKVQCTRL